MTDDLELKKWIKKVHKSGTVGYIYACPGYRCVVQKCGQPQPQKPERKWEWRVWTLGISGYKSGTVNTKEEAMEAAIDLTLPNSIRLIKDLEKD